MNAFEHVKQAILNHRFSDLDTVSYADLLPALKTLYHSSPDLKVPCLQAVGYLGSGYQSLLFDALKDPDMATRERAVKELGFLKDPLALNGLLKTLVMDTSIQVKAAAAEALGMLGSPKALSALLMALDETDPQFLIQVCQALTRLPSKRNLRPLVRLMDTHHHESVLQAAVQAIGSLDTIEALTLLIKMLSDTRSCVRSSALMALGQKRELWLQKYFEILGADSEVEVRRSAFWASSLQDSDRSEQFLSRSVKHMCYEYLKMADRVLDMYHPRSPYF